MALRPDSVCLDIGANIGLTTGLMAQLCPDGAIFAFEPSPRNFHHLTATIARNGLARCHPVNLALAAEGGLMRFYENRQSGAWSGAVMPGFGDAVPGRVMDVRTVSLDEWVEDRALTHLDFIKVDVEGFELAVLKGAARTLARFRPVLLIEFNSLTTICVARALPHDLLADLAALFPLIHVIDRDSGLPIRLDDDAHAKFVYRNLTSGFVDDLLCCFEPGQIDIQRVGTGFSPE